MNLRSYKHSGMILLLTAAFLFLAASGRSQSGSASASAMPPDSVQIVQAIERHDQFQAKSLERYHALRHYDVEYRGFFKNITAKMDVELDYDATTGKSFRILSESGSHTLCEKVLKRALDSEKDAAQDRGAHALTPANYKFELVGIESLGGRPAYILQVEPLTDSPYLYRGEIWVDAADGAVSKMEVQPAKNPSFWISQTLVRQTNSRVGGFWLPQQNRSETKVRIGGRAVLTISYGPYQIAQPQSPHSASGADPELANGTLRASTR
jgi:hypothetical protein